MHRVCCCIVALWLPLCLPMSLPLFIYGTPQDPESLQLALGRDFRDLSFVHAWLDGFRVAQFPGQAYPGLRVETGSRAEGQVIFGLSEADFLALDLFEGGGYRRRAARPSTAAGLVDAEAYLPTVAIGPEAPVWRFTHWLLNHKTAMLAAEAAERQWPYQQED